ncbi:MAG TPA: stage II sporulation protein M [Thermaerobacter sp.]
MSVATYTLGLVLGASLHSAFTFAPERELARLGVGEILVNNLRALAVVLAGMVTLGILTFFGLLYNGAVTGYVISAARDRGLSWIDIARATVPHGIFEVPALLLAGVVGFSALSRLWEMLTGRMVMANYWWIVLCMGMASVGLVVIAAFVEAFLTPLFFVKG